MKIIKRVQADVLHQKISCTILLNEDLRSIEFAFYVFRNGERIHVSWYSPTPSFIFNTEGIPGEYQFTGFARIENKPTVYEKSNRILLSEVETSCDERTLKNYAPWRCKVHKEEGLSEFLSRKVFEEGIHRITCGTTTLDILLQGLPSQNSRDQKICLVGLGGAVSDRTGTSPPYFSGRRVAGNLKIPLIGISDPALDLDESLHLGWYAGNAECRNLSEIIAEILNHLAQCLNLRFVIFGGSGGGFASLIQASLLTCELTAVVWNAQTSIGRYDPKAVLQYIAAAFPDLKSEAHATLKLSKPLQIQSIDRLLQKTGVMHSVLEAPLGKHSKILYLQNRTDWHVYAHAKPYLTQSGWRRLGINSFARGEDLAFHVGDWGDGHVPVPNELLIKVISDIAQGLSVIEIAARLADATPMQQYCQWFAADSISNATRPFLICNNVGSEFHLIIDMPSLPSVERLEYALCLLKNGDRVKFLDYQSSPVFSIILNDCEIDAVDVLVRDFWMEIKACNYSWPLGV